MYDMTIDVTGTVYIPFKKYPEQHHAATLWAGKSSTWKCLLTVGSLPGEGSGGATIAGPDSEGYIYYPGFRFKESDVFEHLRENTRPSQPLR